MNTARSDGSTKSYRPPRVGRYRKVSRDSDVDETLFGNPRSTRSRMTGKTIMKGKTTATNQQQEKRSVVRTKKMTPKPLRAHIISRQELQRIKERTTIITAEELESIEAQRETDNEVLMMKAQERKKHMMRKAEEAAIRAPKTEMELVFEAENQAVLENANYLREQSHDSVKHLKTLGARAAAFTIRDQQIAELETRGDDDKLYDEKMNLRMEIDRLEDLKRLEDIEEAKRCKRYSDRKVLENQIVDRKEILEKEKKKVQQEGQEILERIRQDQLDAEKRDKERFMKQQKDMALVVEFNEDTMRRKKLGLQEIREEDEKIAAYQRKKDEEQMRREVEEERKKQDAELRCAHLRSTQEKAASNKAELDELRAKRAAEAKERVARESEIEMEKRRQDNMRGMMEARKQQAMHKRRALENEAKMQKQEYEATTRRVNEDKLRLEKELREHERKNTEHRRGIQNQISVIESRRKEDFERTQQEGRKLREEYDNELKELESIRKREVEELIAKGVNPCYLTEMKSLDMSKVRNC